MKNIYRQLLAAVSAVSIFIVAASAKAAGECSVMVPMMGTIWKTNEIVTVRWSGVKEGNIPSIMLARTNEEGILVDVAQIARDVPGSSGKHATKLPSNIPPADKYVIILKNGENAKCTSNSFFIEQGSPMAPVDIQNPPPNADLPSLGTPTHALTSVPSSASYTSALTTSHASVRSSRPAREAVRTDAPVPKPNSATRARDAAPRILGLLLGLTVMALVRIV